MIRIIVFIIAFIIHLFGIYFSTDRSVVKQAAESHQFVQAFFQKAAAKRIF